MKPPAFASKLLAAVFAGGTLMATLPAEAGHDRHGWSERRGHSDHRGKGYHSGHKHKHKHVVVKERVVVHPRPVVREYHHYYEPAPVYHSRHYYPRDPSIVIGVSIPPIVIPLR